MDTAEVKESINAAISSERAQVIGLVGDWGVGKTHLWKDYVFANREDLSKRYTMYAYVSLFGLSSARDIKAAILDKLIPTQLVSNDPATTIEEAAKEQTKRRVAIGKGLLTKLRELTKGSDSGWASVGSEAINLAIVALEYRAAQRALICFDDLERMSPTLFPSDVMGVVDNLARERGCKVVVIFSPENMGRNADDLAKYREKLFDRELRLSPPNCLFVGDRLRRPGQTRDGCNIGWRETPWPTKHTNHPAYCRWTSRHTRARAENAGFRRTEHRLFPRLAYLLSSRF